MPCDEERAHTNGANEEWKQAELAMETARRKARNALKAAGATCTGGAIASLFGPAALVAGGVACIGALLLADDFAADFEEAAERHDMARDKASEAFKELYLCMSRCQRAPAQA